jgi:hypothetical protein
VYPKLLKIVRLMMLLTLAFSAGCMGDKVKTVFVPDGDPMRLSEDVTVKKPFVRDAKGEWLQSSNDAIAKAGQYVITDPGDKKPAPTK